MRILLIHNHYGGFSGETSVMEQHENMLEARGHEIMRYTRSSVELETMPFGKTRAFFTGLYNPFSVREIERVLKEFRPDVAHIHNLYPLISPAILPRIRRAGVPVVMTVHNYRLVCPNGLFYNRQGICERCAGGKEWNCIRWNCEESFPKSAGYALRNAWARIARYYRDHVDMFLCLTGFQKQKLIENGFPEERCRVLPNFIGADFVTTPVAGEKRNGFLSIGRLNLQKGADILIEAARKLPSFTFSMIGAIDEQVVDPGNIPPNVRLLGVASEEEKQEAIRRARALVFTSRSYEGFPMVFLESMQKGLPVVAPRLAGYPEVIRENETGWLFEPENVADLVETLRAVHGDSPQAAAYGRKGIETVREWYGPDAWYEKYMNVLKESLSGTEERLDGE